MENLLNFNSRDKQFVSYSKFTVPCFFDNYGSNMWHAYKNNMGYEYNYNAYLIKYSNNVNLYDNNLYCICKLSKLDNSYSNSEEFKNNYKNLTSLTSTSNAKICSQHLKNPNVIYEYVGITLNMAMSSVNSTIEQLTYNYFKSVYPNIDNDMDMTIDKQKYITTTEGLNIDDTMYYNSIKTKIITMLLDTDCNINKILDYTNNNVILEHLVFMWIYKLHLVYKQYVSVVIKNYHKKQKHIAVINSLSYWNNKTMFINFNTKKMFEVDDELIDDFNVTPKRFFEIYFKNNSVYDEYWYMYSKQSQIKNMVHKQKEHTSNTTNDLLLNQIKCIPFVKQSTDFMDRYHNFKINFRDTTQEYNYLLKPDICMFLQQNIINSSLIKLTDLKNNYTAIIKNIMSPYLVNNYLVDNNEYASRNILKTKTLYDEYEYTFSNTTYNKTMYNYDVHNIKYMNNILKDYMTLWYNVSLYNCHTNNRNVFYINIKMNSDKKSFTFNMYINNNVFNDLFNIKYDENTRSIVSAKYSNDYTNCFVNTIKISDTETVFNRYYDKIITCLTKTNSYKQWEKNDESTEYKFDINSFPKSLQDIFQNISLDLFDYQKENIKWMNTVEHGITNNNYTYDNKILALYLKCFSSTDINKTLYKTINKYDDTTEMFNITLSKLDILQGTDYSYYSVRVYLLKKVVKYHVVISKLEMDNINKKNQAELHTLDSFNDNRLKFVDDTLLRYCIDYILDNCFNDQERGYNFPLKGGLLCDDVGLGKTLSTVTHCLHQLESDNKNALPITNNTIKITEPIYLEADNGVVKNSITKWMLNNLIIVPTRLIKQWAFEIEKYSSNFPDDKKPTVKTLVSITDIKKFVKNNVDRVKKGKPIQRPDFIIMSVNLFTNANYKKYLVSSYYKLVNDRMKSNPDYKNQFDNYEYSLTDYFDVFQIKWNRIIIDEVHESIMQCIGYYNNYTYKIATSTERKKVYSILYFLNSNFKWGLSATPFQKEHSGNIYGYMNWLNDTYKLLCKNIYITKEQLLSELDNINTISKVKTFSTAVHNDDNTTTGTTNNTTDTTNQDDSDIIEDYYNDTNSKLPFSTCFTKVNGDTKSSFTGKYYLALPFIEYYNECINVKKLNKMYINVDLLNDNLYNILTQTSDVLFYSDINKFTEATICKTIKSDVKANIGIPIFTEEVKWITLSNVEKNIYNNAKQEVYGNYYNRDKIYGIKRLFQICTNILISEDDIQNMELGDIEDRIVSLEDINKNMIKHFERNLKSSKKDLEKVLTTIKDYGKMLDLMKAFIHVMKKKWTPSITDFTKKHNQEYYFVNTYFDKFNSVINRMKQYSSTNNSRYGYNDPSRYINTNDISKFESYQLINVFMNDAIESYIDDIRDLQIFQYSDSDTEHTNPSITNDMINTEINPRMINVENIIKSNIGCFTQGNLKIDPIVKSLLYKATEKKYNYYNNTIKNSKDKISRLEQNIKLYTNQIKLFESNDFIKEKTEEPCIICWSDYEEDSKVVITQCRHVMCGDCFEILTSNQSKVPCPECRQDINPSKVNITLYSDIMNNGSSTDEPETDETQETTPEQTSKNAWIEECLNKYGTKMTELIKTLKDLFKPERDAENNRVIVFSQYDNMLKLVSRTLKEYDIKNVHIKGNVHSINKNIDKFKRDSSIRVIMLSSENSNSGCNLTEANHIIFIDVINAEASTSKDMECQAIGRSVRLGQKRPVKLIRFITKNTIEEEYYTTNKYDINTIQ